MGKYSYIKFWNMAEWCLPSIHHKVLFALVNIKFWKLKLCIWVGLMERSDALSRIAKPLWLIGQWLGQLMEMCHGTFLSSSRWLVNETCKINDRKLLFNHWFIVRNHDSVWLGNNCKNLNVYVRDTFFIWIYYAKHMVCIFKEWYDRKFLQWEYMSPCLIRVVSYLIWAS